MHANVTHFAPTTPLIKRMHERIGHGRLILIRGRRVESAARRYPAGSAEIPRNFSAARMTYAVAQRASHGFPKLHAAQKAAKRFINSSAPARATDLSAFLTNFRPRDARIVHCFYIILFGYVWHLATFVCHVLRASSDSFCEAFVLTLVDFYTLCWLFTGLQSG